MEITINLDNVKTHIPSGRISNFFKNYQFKNLKFEESLFLELHKKLDKNDEFTQEKYYKFAERKINEFSKAKKDEFHYQFNQLAIKTIPNLLNKKIKPNIEFKNIIQENKAKVLQNKLIIEKMEKLKKLRNYNQ